MVSQLFLALHSHLSHADGDDGHRCTLCVAAYSSVFRFSDYLCSDARDSCWFPKEIELLSFQGFLTVFEQIVIGVAMGFVTQFMIQTFVMLGQILGMQSSLGFASMVDPANGQNTPVLGQLFMLLATMFFLATDGHLKMLQLVVFSFKTLPIGSGSLTSVDFRELALWLGIMFKTALAMSLSGIIALLTINLSFGVMTRAAPQLNIFSLGFAFALLVGLLLCWYILGGLYSHYELFWMQGEQQICRLIRLDC